MRRTTYLILFAVILLLTSCGTARVQKSTQTQAIDSALIVETTRDTVVRLKSDSAMIRALLECDSLGQVRMRELLEYQAGDRLKPPQLQLDNNVLTATAEIDSLSIYMQLRDRYEKHVSKKDKTETVIVEVNRLTWWQTLWVTTGKILAAALALWIAIKLLKPKILTLWQRTRHLNR